MGNPAWKVQEEDFIEAQDCNTGWCPECKDFTRDNTEPDADGYGCPICETSGVMGAEQALLVGAIELVGGDA